jgi:asparagine synthase (glutamine-hydrolysing)
MVPAHHVVHLELIGCPDPDPVYTRFFTPEMAVLPPDLNRIGEAYIAALADEIAIWLKHLPAAEPIGVCFSGGIDSGSVFLTTYHVLRKLGMNPARLKAFVLDLGDGPDVEQAREFLDALGLGLFLEPMRCDAASLDAGRPSARWKIISRSMWSAPRWLWRCAKAFARGIPNGFTWWMETVVTRT